MGKKSKVSYLPTQLDVPVDRVLDSEKIRACKRVIVIGWDENDILNFASSTGDIADIVLMLETAKQAAIGSMYE